MNSLATYLSEQGHEVAVLTSVSKGAESEERIRGFHVIRELVLDDEQGSVQYYKQNRLLRESILKYSQNFDIVHYNGINLLGFRNLKRRRQNPMVTTVHGYSPICIYCTLLNYRNEICTRPGSDLACTQCYLHRHRERRLLSPIIRAVISAELNARKKGISAFDKIICVSKYVENTLERIVNEEKLLVIPNMVNLDEISRTLYEGRDFDLREHFQIPPSGRVILYAGRLTPTKWIEGLISAFRVVKCKFHNSYLIIIGEGPSRSSLETLCRDLKESVCLPGILPRRKVLQAIRQSTVFVLPSAWPEPCSTSILEAIALNSPIVATNVGGSPELLRDYDKAVLIQRNNVDDLARGLLTALDRYSDYCPGPNSSVITRYDVRNVGSCLVHTYSALLGKDDSSNFYRY